MTIPPEKGFYTEEEYWALVEGGDEFRRHELVNGEVFDRLGSSPNHNSIVANMISTLNGKLPQACRIFGPDIFVQTDAAEGFLCPDVTVTCAPLVHHQDRKNVIANPELIVEVLSPSTADYDRGEKWTFYQAIERLQDYVLINQDRYQLAHYHRKGPNRWDYQLFHGPDAEITFSSIDLTFTLQDLYQRVVWE